MFHSIWNVHPIFPEFEFKLITESGGLEKKDFEAQLFFFFFFFLLFFRLGKFVMHRSARDPTLSGLS